MLAASPVRAADSFGSSQSRTLVVRVDPRTGRLIRGVAPAARTSVASKNISELVAQSARAHDVDPLLIDSVIKVESNYDSQAVSPKGAQGLMQLMPSTARMLGVSDSLDPQQNIEAGVKYLKYLQTVYKDDRLALAAYNAGPGAVEKYRQVPPYRETQDYVNRVGKQYNDARKAAVQKDVPATPQGQPVGPPQAQVIEEKHPKLEQFLDENGRLHLRTSQ